MKTFLSNLWFDINRQWQFFSIRFDNYMQFGVTRNYPRNGCIVYSFMMIRLVDERTLTNVQEFEEIWHSEAFGQIGNYIIAIRNWR